jgi:hypothetical protein
MGDMEVRVYTTRANSLDHVFEAPAPNIKIIRIGGIPQRSLPKRLAVYFQFYLGVLLRMISWRPDTVLYYESISSWPGLVYKKWVNRGCSLFIHYHEYCSTEEYNSGMIFVRWFHRSEKKIYPRTAWLSHTNQDRMDAFCADNEGIAIPHKRILPNYPSAKWAIAAPRLVNSPLKIIYIGALSMEAMYVREFSEWVLSKGGQVLWDIYSVNISPEVKEYLSNLDKNIIGYRGICNYYELPKILPQYDVGVVLYKGIIRNHIIAVSNKVFEYLSNGLDVWYSREMTGTDPYITKGVFPKVIPMNCQSMSDFDLASALDRTGLEYRRSPYCYEDIYLSLLEEMIAQ